MTLPQFVEAVEAYLAISKIPPTRLGKEATGDPGFVFDLRAGRQPRRESMKKVMDYIAAAKVAA